MIARPSRWLRSAQRRIRPKLWAAPGAEDNFSLIKVADGVYAAMSLRPGGLASGNAGFVIGDESVLVFDTFFTPAEWRNSSAKSALTNFPSSLPSTVTYHLDHTEVTRCSWREVCPSRSRHS